MTDTAREPGVARVAADILHVRRAFGEPIITGDTTLVPVALVSGGSGFGGAKGSMDGRLPGEGESGGTGTGSGEGGGYGVYVRPLGTYVVRGSEVRWEPALDLIRVILGGQVMVAVVGVAIACALRKRRRR